MPKLSYIQYPGGKREMLYGKNIPKGAEEVVIETVTENDFEAVKEMTLEDVKKRINSILDFKT